MKLGLKLRGFEKFWSPIFGAGMCASVTVLVMFIASKATGGYITMPTPEVVAAAIAGFVATLFSAASSFIATTSAPTDAEPNSNQIGVPMPVVPTPTPTTETTP